MESHHKNPRRVAAGLQNGSKRRPWTDEDREKQRQNALEAKPWQLSTGPRSDEGKKRSAANGRHPANPDSLRQLRASLAAEYGVMDELAGMRRALGIA
jgi:hypothetical protein